MYTVYMFFQAAQKTKHLTGNSALNLRLPQGALEQQPGVMWNSQRYHKLAIAPFQLQRQWLI